MSLTTPALVVATSGGAGPTLKCEHPSGVLTPHTPVSGAGTSPSHIAPNMYTNAYKDHLSTDKSLSTTATTGRPGIPTAVLHHSMYTNEATDIKMTPHP